MLSRLSSLAFGAAGMVLGACGAEEKHENSPTTVTATVAAVRSASAMVEAPASPTPETDAEYAAKVDAAVESLGADAVDECKAYVREACKRQTKSSRASLCMTYADSIRPTAASAQGSIVCKAAANGFTR